MASYFQDCNMAEQKAASTHTSITQYITHNTESLKTFKEMKTKYVLINKAEYWQHYTTIV